MRKIGGHDNPALKPSEHAQVAKRLVKVDEHLEAIIETLLLSRPGQLKQVAAAHDVATALGALRKAMSEYPHTEDKGQPLLAIYYPKGQVKP